MANIYYKMAYAKLADEPQIVYACLAENSSVKYEYAARKGNLHSVAQEVIRKVSAQKSQLSLNYKNEYHIHYELVNGMVYLGITDSQYPKRQIYSFLLEIREVYQKGGVSQFDSTLKQIVSKYNSDEGDSIQKAKRNISEVNSIMLENLDKVIERGIKIEVLEQKTEVLEEKSITFRSESARLKRKMCWQSYKWTIIIVLVVIVVIALIAIISWAAISQ